MTEQRIREEKEFPSDLEERLAVVLNGINTELKTVTLLHLDDKPADEHEIKARIRETMGRGYLPHASVFIKYSDTLQGIALVAKETVIRDTGEVVYIGYSLTDAGRKYGLPIAEHALRYSVDNNTSMFSVLGPTNSRGTSRAPYNRTRILEALSIGDTTEGDLTDFIKLADASVKNHLMALAKIGFLRFDSIGAKQKGYAVYEWTGDISLEGVVPVRNLPTLTKKVAGWFANSQDEGEHNKIAEALNYKHPEHISVILRGLEKQGVIRRKSIFKGRERSRIEILDSGRTFLGDVIEPIRRHLSDEIILEHSLANSERFGFYVSNGIEVYRKVSP